MKIARPPAVEAYARHVNPGFVRLLGLLGYGRVFVRAEGSRVFDDQGRSYLDLLSGYGASSLGHHHPRLAGRIRAFLDEAPLNLNHVGPSPSTAALAERLAALAPKPLELALFASGGAEGVEAALKIAACATGRARFLHCAGGYHGTSLGTLPLMGDARMRAPFEPLLHASGRVPFGDLPALERELAKGGVAAFVAEPVQGEGGVILPPPGYLAAAAALCRRHGALFVLDEVQTGLGRCGTLFACEAEGVVPDALVLGKALGGGLAPISAALVSRELYERAYGPMERFDLHSSTFGGNALACAVALETLDVISDERLAERSARLGARLLDRLKRGLDGHPLVHDVRGRGLLAAIELGPTGRDWLSRQAPELVAAVSSRLLGPWISMRLLEKGFLLQSAALRWEVLRIEPPLNIGESELDAAADAVIETVKDYRSLAPLAAQAGPRLLSQFANGGSFG